jgi:hypothetical protein
MKTSCRNPLNPLLLTWENLAEEYYVPDPDKQEWINSAQTGAFTISISREGIQIMLRLNEDNIK